MNRKETVKFFEVLVWAREIQEKKKDTLIHKCAKDARNAGEQAWKIDEEGRVVFDEKQCLKFYQQLTKLALALEAEQGI